MITRLRGIGVKCFIVETTRPFNISIQRRIIQIIKEENITIIHAHGTRAASNVLYPSIRLGLPLVYTVHGWSFHKDQGKITYTLRKWSEKLICRYATRVICVSEGSAETGRKAFRLTDPIVIKNEQNGLIVPFSSPDKISDAILCLLTDENLRNRCRQNVASLVSVQFNAQRVADAVVDIYKNVPYKDKY